jgi:hypothetical protein
MTAVTGRLSGADPHLHAQLSVGDMLHSWTFLGCVCNVNPRAKPGIQLKESSTVSYRQGQDTDEWIAHDHTHPPLILQHGMEIQLAVGGAGRQFDTATVLLVLTFLEQVNRKTT